ncbi:MAG: His-Xaa-Ser system radical SAM maturase HxsB [Actinobacteria bacterium]|nr:His-Xaa-Ser system radical SAM maturase HxsB [Actinomycetota bacterium]
MKPLFFRFKQFNSGTYLLTNEIGEYVFLNKKDFNDYSGGKLTGKQKAHQELLEKNFIDSEAGKRALAEKYKVKNNFLQQGPSLHIIVTTLRCDHKCVYCQTSSRGAGAKNFDMDAATAKKAVDLIFESPSPAIAIEFQGGEPLLNWEIVKFITDYAIEKRKNGNKDLEIRLMSNFSLMDEEKMKFFLDRTVGLCTSLDSPQEAHDKNRLFLGKGSSHGNTVKWINKARKAYGGKVDKFMPGAVMTVTKHAFPYFKEMVDEYIGLGFEGIFLRPLTRLGVARNAWKAIGYTPEEYIKFYKKTVDYIIELNVKKNIKFYERTAAFFLTKILNQKDPNYLDSRSPCGAGIGQILYNYNGDIYTCDEGRMLGDDTFKIGKIGKNCYNDIIGHDTVKAMCVASCLDGLACDHCVYKPYCGVCPVLSYSQYGTIFPQLPKDEKCKANKGILDYLFLKLKDKKNYHILKKWAKKH